MKPKLVVARALAKRDIEQATRYYRLESTAKVALAFVAAIGEAYSHIGRHPAAGSPRYAELLDLPGLRYWPLKRFPYLAFYVEHDDYVEIWRVLHGGSDIAAKLPESQDAASS